MIRHNQGHHKLTPAEVERVCQLLKETALNGADIAKRVGVSRSAIYLINKRFKARDFQKRD